MDQLYKIFSKLQTPNSASTPTTSGSLAHMISFSRALSVLSRSNNPWILDSGASHHMTDAYTLFSSYKPCAGNLKVQIADGSYASVAGKGCIQLSTPFVLENVLHIPNLSCNLLSISQFTKQHQCVAKFFPTHAEFQDLSSETMIGSAKECEGLYYLADKTEEGQQPAVVCGLVSVPTDNPLLLWHYRMGHPNFQYLKYVFPSLFQNKKASSFQCEVCELAKHHRASFPKSIYKPSKPFALIHSDVWGPSRILNRTHSKWFVTFIDDHTRVCWVYLLKDKTEVRSVFVKFHSMIQTQFQTKIQILRTDNGTEYVNHILQDYLQTQGIIHQSSCVDTPQQNGVAERKNRHLLEITRALLLSTNLPQYYWGMLF